MTAVTCLPIEVLHLGPSGAEMLSQTESKQVSKVCCHQQIPVSHNVKVCAGCSHTAWRVVEQGLNPGLGNTTWRLALCTRVQSDLLPPTMTPCFRPSRNAWIHLMLLPLMVWASTFLSSYLGGTLLNTFARSRYMTSTSWLLSIMLLHSLIACGIFCVIR